MKAFIIIHTIIYLALVILNLGLFKYEDKFISKWEKEGNFTYDIMPFIILPKIFIILLTPIQVVLLTEIFKRIN